MAVAGLQRLEDALVAALEADLGLDEDDARSTAMVVVAAFEGNEEACDDGLTQDLRAIFYTLEKRRWLGFRREEAKREDGSTRRVFYWTVRWDELLRAAGSRPGRREAQASGNVYESLPRAAWRRVSA